MLYLNGHNYKYAAEQMLLSPRDVPSRGDASPGLRPGGPNWSCACKRPQSPDKGPGGRVVFR